MTTIGQAVGTAAATQHDEPAEQSDRDQRHAVIARGRARR